MFLQSVAQNYGFGIKYNAESNDESYAIPIKKGFQIIPIPSASLLKDILTNFDFSIPIRLFESGYAPIEAKALDIYLVQRITWEQLPVNTIVSFTPLNSNGANMELRTQNIKEIFLLCKVNNNFVIDYILIVDSINTTLYTNTIEIKNSD